MVNLKLTSSAFEDGGEIPRECGYKNGNEDPPLAISGISEGTESLALIMDDPDAMGAVGKVWVHWVAWNISPPYASYFDSHGKMLDSDNRTWNGVWMEPPPGIKPWGQTEGTTDFGEVGYGGPAPPDKRHTYVFKLYALDCELELAGAEATKADVEKAMEGHIIEQTQLTGTYAP